MTSFFLLNKFLFFEMWHVTKPFLYMYLQLLGLLIFMEYQWDKITVWSVEKAKKQKVKFLQVRKKNWVGNLFNR